MKEKEPKLKIDATGYPIIRIEERTDFIPLELSCEDDDGFLTGNEERIMFSGGEIYEIYEAPMSFMGDRG